MPALLWLGATPQEWILYPLQFVTDRPFIIGRQKESTERLAAANLVLQDERPAVSRHHAYLTQINRNYYIQDRSRNGCMLNNRPVSKVSPILIQHGDMLKMVDFLFQFVDDCYLVGQVPFAPQPIADSWRTEHTIGISAKMREDGNLAALPILADALEEAGCDNLDILSHCREPGIHIRGCWVVDLLLGKV